MTTIRFDRLRDAVALTRPTLMIPLWTMHVLGAVHSTDRLLFMPTAAWGLLSLAHTFLLGAVYIVNQLTDLETDAVNAKLFLLADGHINRRFAVGETLVLLALSAGTMAIGVWIGWVRVEAIALFVASSLLGALYCAPPFRLKARAGWDLAANAVGYGIIAFAVGWVAFEPWTLRLWQLAAPYGLSVAATFAFTTIPDIPGDAAADDRTIGVRLGDRATGVVGIVFLCLGCLAAFAVRNYLALNALAPSLALYWWAMRRLWRRGDVRSLLRATQFAILWLSLLAVIGAPVYGCWLVLVVAWVRRYYRRRFSVRYP